MTQGVDSELLANGCPIGHIRAMLGHEHLTTTCRYYLGIIAEKDVKAAHAKYLSYDVDSGNTTDGKLRWCPSIAWMNMNKREARTLAIHS